MNAIKNFNMTSLKNAVKTGDIVIFAGAGISKDAPANIPDWNEYNNLIIKEIGAIGSVFLENSCNVLGDGDYSRLLSLTSLSDFIFNYIAGDSYFPLLKVLDGSRPNSHHILLASLAKEKRIKAIVTTNFDTLIEQAFVFKNVPFKVYESPCDFKIEKDLNVFPIYKIHGSVTNTQNAIDTVRQKVKGLSKEKLEVLQHLFKNNHFVFIGYSGADFDFKDEYIPIDQARKGITWVTWNISERLRIFNESFSNFEVKKLTGRKLNSFYEEIGWMDCWVDSCDNNDSLICYDEVSEEIREILKASCVPDCAFAGMCIKILEAMCRYEEVNKYIEIFDRKLKKIFGGKDDVFDHIIIPDIEKSSLQPRHTLHLGKVTHSEAYGYIALLDTIGDVFVRSKKPDVALEYYIFSLSIQKAREFLYVSGMLQCDSSKLYNNLSTTLGRIVRVYLCAEDYEAAHKFSIEAEKSALAATQLYDFSIMHYYNVISKYGKNIDSLNFFMELCVCIRLAQSSGAVNVLFDIYVKLAQIFYKQNQILMGNCALQEARRFSQISFDNYHYKEDLKNYDNPEDVIKTFRNYIASIGIYIENTSEYQWPEVVERDILKYNEGRLAKIKFEEGKFEEAIEILEKAPFNYDCKKPDFNIINELFCFAAVRVAILSRLPVNNSKLKNLLTKCIHLQIENLQTDYLVLTMHYYCQILMQEEEYLHALFYIRIIQSICISPEEHSVILGVCLSAAICCHKIGLNADAGFFLTKYLRYCQDYPDLIDHNMDEYVEYLRELCLS